MDEDIDAVIVGGGQAGLATAHELGRRGVRAVVLERDAEIGSSWRRRWDSLRLFTPAERDGLPGTPFPAERGSLPTKEEVAAYLARYAAALPVPVETGVEVRSAERNGAGFRVRSADREWRSRAVVMATGGNAVPWRPAFADTLDRGIRQVHAGEYRNPQDLPAGDVVVVGAGTSGVEIALELAASRRVLLAGRPTPRVPAAVLRYAGTPYWHFAHHVLTRRTPIGRKVATVFHRRGAPLLRVSAEEAYAAGVEAGARAVDAVDGALRLADGATVRPDVIVWATGFRPDLRPFPGLRAGDGGVPQTRRGVVADVPGLYTVGMPFQYGLTSGLIGGVGRDARAIAARMAG